jgi:hypothetical protein
MDLITDPADRKKYRNLRDEAHQYLILSNSGKIPAYSTMANIKAAEADEMRHNLAKKYKIDLDWIGNVKEGAAESPDYAAMYESKLNEFASAGGGAGSVATTMGVGGGSNVGSLFGGSYSPKNSPFKKPAKKRTGKMLKR